MTTSHDTAHGHELEKNRVEAFSDGVFAIILTLLVLELRVPEVPDHSSLSAYVTAMAPLLPKFIGFLLTFIMIAMHWVSHHFFFHHLRHARLGLVWLNNLLLLWLCFLPFPTALFGDHPTDQFPILLYAADSLLVSLTFFCMRWYAVRHHLFAEVHDEVETLGPSQSVPAIVVFSAAIILSFVHFTLALACLMLIPVLYFLPTSIGSKRAARRRRKGGK